MYNWCEHTTPSKHCQIYKNDKFKFYRKQGSWPMRISGVKISRMAQIIPQTANKIVSLMLGMKKLVRNSKRLNTYVNNETTDVTR